MARKKPELVSKDWGGDKGSDLIPPEQREPKDQSSSKQDTKPKKAAGDILLGGVQVKKITMYVRPVHVSAMEVIRLGLSMKGQKVTKYELTQEAFDLLVKEHKKDIMRVQDEMPMLIANLPI